MLDAPCRFNGDMVRCIPLCYHADGSYNLHTVLKNNPLVCGGKRPACICPADHWFNFSDTIAGCKTVKHRPATHNAADNATSNISTMIGRMPAFGKDQVGYGQDHIPRTPKSHHRDHKDGVYGRGGLPRERVQMPQNTGLSSGD